MVDGKLTLNEAASRLNMTPEQLKNMVASGQVQAEGSGDDLLFDPSNLPGAATDDIITLDDTDDFTLKLQDEQDDNDLTVSTTAPPEPVAVVSVQPSDTNVFGDDTVDLMDIPGGTDTIELTDDSITDADSLLGTDTLVGGSDTMGTDTLMAQDSLASTEGTETFLVADILDGLSGDTTAEITSEVRAPDGVPMQYIAVQDEKSPATTFMLVMAVIFMVLSVVIFVNGLSPVTDEATERLVFKTTRSLLDLK